MRKHIGWYLKNQKNASRVREKINQIEGKQKVIDCLTEYFQAL